MGPKGGVGGPGPVPEGEKAMAGRIGSATRA